MLGDSRSTCLVPGGCVQSSRGSECARTSSRAPPSSPHVRPLVPCGVEKGGGVQGTLGNWGSALLLSPRTPQNDNRRATCEQCT